MKLITAAIIALIALTGCYYVNPNDVAAKQELSAILQVDKPLPTIYSRWNGVQLTPKAIKIEVVTHDPQTGMPYFTVTVDYRNPTTHWWSIKKPYNKGTAILVRPLDHPTVFSSSTTQVFTLQEYKADPTLYYWEVGLGY